MSRRHDFHVYSWWSYDAHLSPEEIFGAADAAGPTAVATTDHHTLSQQHQ